MKGFFKHKVGMVWFLVIFSVLVLEVFPQVMDSRFRSFASNVIVPQARAFPTHPSSRVEVTGVDVRVTILEQAASTVMDVSLKNPGARLEEAELIMPVPEGAVVRGFTFQGSAKEPTAQILKKEEARRIYDSIVAKTRDPALLEFIGYGLVRSSVFPVPARGEQKIRLIYEHILEADGERVDYTLPRSESLEYEIPWNITVTIKSKSPISTVYSPTHDIVTERFKPSSGFIAGEPANGSVKVRLSEAATREPGPFLLSYLLETRDISASLFAYPDTSSKGGYFLLLAGLPARLPEKGAIKRELTLVLDRSGSMRGEKIEQAREAALQVIEGLDRGEAFNLITYNESVELFAAAPVLKKRESMEMARRFIKGIRISGGTNIYDALQEALRQKPREGMLPIVLFLTDGLPTVGRTSEKAIRDLAMKGNPYNRRIYTFGVGTDVNTPLLDKIAVESRATSTYILPGEDIEVKVARVFQQLYGPVLANPEIEVVDDGMKRTRDLIPSPIPDLFEGDQLVLLGRYLGEDPLTFLLKGNYLGKNRTFRFRFQLSKATVRNAFVPRLWAGRKIALLVDAIRQSGADSDAMGGGRASGRDPRLRELTEEIVRLGTEFGILTEYTAFLAREGTDLSDRDEIMNTALNNFEHRAVKTRTGLAALNQSLNYNFQKGQKVLNRKNTYFNQNLERVQVTTVQQVNDLAFYRRGNQWIDGRIVGQKKTSKPKRVIRYGSREFTVLMERLAKQNRQGAVSLRGDILMVVDNEPVLVKGPENM